MRWAGPGAFRGKGEAASAGWAEAKRKPGGVVLGRRRFRLKKKEAKKEIRKERKREKEKGQVGWAGGFQSRPHS